MALSEIKTNIKKNKIKQISIINKGETKDEPQSNDNYKIRQLTIKIMEYTHIHIHP